MIIETQPVLVLTYVVAQTNRVELRCVGLTPNNTYHVQASADLRQWTEIGAQPAAADGTFLFLDTDLAAHPVRYYRLSNY